MKWEVLRLSTGEWFAVCHVQNGCECHEFLTWSEAFSYALTQARKEG